MRFAGLSGLTPVAGICVAGAISLAAGRAGSQETGAAPGGAAMGSAYFKTYCATCHGTDAKGGGPLANHLKFRPPDLTQLARRNGGTYAPDRVYRMIDGRDPLPGHGGPEMPIWGDAFRTRADGYSEETVRERISLIVRFLSTIQAE
jgi:mono/diheme cytochrome c family protein